MSIRTAIWRWIASYQSAHAHTRGILEAHNKCELSIKIVKARMLHWNPYDNDENRQNQAMCKIRVNNLDSNITFSSPFDCAQDYINSKSQLNFFFNLSLSVCYQYMGFTVYEKIKRVSNRFIFIALLSTDAWFIN